MYDVLCWHWKPLQGKTYFIAWNCVQCQLVSLRVCMWSGPVGSKANIQLSVYGGLNGKDLDMSITPAQPPDGSPWSTYGLFLPTFQVLSTNSANILGIFPQKKNLSQLKQLIIEILSQQQHLIYIRLCILY